MPRGKKMSVMVLRCAKCNKAVQSIHINKKMTPKPQFSKYCGTCQKRVELKAKDEVK